MKIVVSEFTEENNGLLESILKKCEYEEDAVYKRFVVLLNVLCSKHNVDMDIVSELEDLYIEKGYVYCSTFIKLRYSHS
ncbi:predicted oxidoreductase [Paenibacillus popilliae ATCC 14706]|uniref:Predicted oxidoreductase n=1 Tax=Paenibacillus popilliae ATCC 14706 TaxID=1212764 RepID=M9M135_PAEPP|nr:predicted oxidoreductase [Paenibacillus popilliae ATCC 14706]